MATNDCLPISGRLFVTDRRTKTQFLVDTGSDLCVFPCSALKERRPKSTYQLSAANGSTIDTYGDVLLRLDLGLRREFSWRFTVANVTKPIIGVDFLAHFHIIVDCRNQRLIDDTTSLSATAAPTKSSDIISSVKIMTGDTQYHALLKKFPEITRPPTGTERLHQHNTVHHIKTTPGPPIACTARRLAPDKLKIARQEFEEMLKN